MNYSLPYRLMFCAALAALALAARGEAQPLPQWLGAHAIGGHGAHVVEILPVDAAHCIAGLSDGRMIGLEMTTGGALEPRWRFGPNPARRLTDLAAADGVIAASLYSDGLAFFAGDGTTTPALEATAAWPPGVALGVALRDGVAYAAAGYDGLALRAYQPGAPPLNDIASVGFVERARLSGDILIVGEGRDGLTLLRVEGPGALTVLGSLIISGRIEDFALDGATLAIAAGSDGLLLYDVSDPATPMALDWRNEWACARVAAFDGGFVTGGWTLASWGVGPDGKLIPRAQVLAGGSVASLAVMGGRVLAGNFEGGINVFDLAGRATPQAAFRFNTGRFIEQFDFNGRWIAGIGPPSRLWFFEWSEAAQTAALLNELPGNNFKTVILNDDAAWSADSDRAFEIWRHNPVANRFDLEWRETGLSGNAGDFAAVGEYLYVAAHGFGWRVYSLADEAAPAQLAAPPSPLLLDQIEAGGGRLYARYQFQGVQAFTLDDPLAPQPRGRVFPWLPFHISARGDHVFLARRRYGMDIWSFADPDAPQHIGGLPLFDARMTLPMNDQYVLVAEGIMGAAVVDWSEPAAPRLVCRLAAVDGAPVHWLHRAGNRIAAASGQSLVFWPTGEIFQSGEFEGESWMMR